MYVRCKIDKMVYYKISKYTKLAQKKSKTRHDWVRKVILGELCKILKFKQTNEWYIAKPEPAQVNKTHEIM